jgi:hypothetical protein
MCNIIYKWKLEVEMGTLFIFVGLFQFSLFFFSITWKVMNSLHFFEIPKILQLYNYAKSVNIIII